MGLLYLQDEVSIHAACAMLYAAILASYITKFFFLWNFAPPRITFQTSSFLLIMLASGGFVYWLTF